MNEIDRNKVILTSGLSTHQQACMLACEWDIIKLTLKE